ncbi:MAG TPA: preprotein translocase subunit SecA [Gaiellaceae bacterium]|jgi:preprotein translocase subunit SecA|nr:preprotein translocase subunit SecA [Gaiellaceae bacterium]
MAEMGDGFEKFFRFGEGRRMKRIQQQAAYVATLEPEFHVLSDRQLLEKTVEFRERLANGEELNNLLFEAFAAVREARLRESDQRMFDVQMMGGIVLHEGDVAEMKTGEGKTFVASLALYLNALPTVELADGRTLGQGVHLVTVNDYLAKRDAEWNRGVYERLGMTVAHIEAELQMDFAKRKAAYEADITYGTNSEFGFDYLRDNMSVSLEGIVQRGHRYAIVDEVDSILIDEARTPLIISGEPTGAAKVYADMARIARGLRGVASKGSKVEDAELQHEYDYLYEEKHKTVSATESGIEKVERALKIENLYAPENVQLVNHLQQALKAEALFKRDTDYVIEDGEVKIVDEFTGRIMEGRRWSEGLHQAVEAKEGVAIQDENLTLATITLQNYFRLYEKLGGMTGTAKTEEKEFVEIYGLEVVPIPTNVDVARKDENDLIFKTVEGKFMAVTADIKERHATGQPVLVGTIAVETSELLSELLKRQGVPHKVLNAKEHASEAEIIKDAGQIGAVTIATNMAGRGVDIKIDDDVKALGGLYVLGTERHEARRIDNQLRGRSGRQGDPGETRFYLSGQDDLVRLFAGDRLYNIMDRFKVPDDQPMDQKILTNQIENAQKKVEEQNFVQRKNVLKYDDVMNAQRMVIYEQRRAVLEGQDLSEEIKEIWLPEVIENVVEAYTTAEIEGDWDLGELVAAMEALYGTGVAAEELKGLDRNSIVSEFLDDATDAYLERERQIESIHEGLMRDLERFMVLQVVDVRWREHLENMDYLRDGIHLRGHAQKDPLVEYRNEGHTMFQELSRLIHEEVVALLFHAQIEAEDGANGNGSGPLPAGQPSNGGGRGLSYQHETVSGAQAMAAAGGNPNGMAMQGNGAPPPAPVPVVKSEQETVGRNDPCWCGSGKKFKRCHGA